MAMSILQTARLAEAMVGIDAAQKSSEQRAIVIAFGRLAEVADTIGYTADGRRPSSLGIAEFLKFVQDELPAMTAATPEDQALLDQLAKMTPK